MNGWKRLTIFWSERLQGCRLRTSVVILEGFHEPILDVTFVFFYVWSWIEEFHATSSDFRFRTNTRLDQCRHMLRTLSMRLNWKWESGFWLLLKWMFVPCFACITNPKNTFVKGNSFKLTIPGTSGCASWNNTFFWCLVYFLLFSKNNDVSCLGFWLLGNACQPDLF